MKTSDREIMEILEAFDATGCARSAAGIVGVDPKTVRRGQPRIDLAHYPDHPQTPDDSLRRRSPGPEARPRQRSSRSVRVRTRGWSRQPRPARGESDRR